MWKVDPKLDLVLERVIDVPCELGSGKPGRLRSMSRSGSVPGRGVFRGVRSISVRGIFRTVMRSPGGEAFPNIGCYLEVVPNERLVWTDALLPGFRPGHTPLEAAGIGSFLTAIILMAPEGSGTAVHGDCCSIAMKRPGSDTKTSGFHRRRSWGRRLDQLVEP